VASVALVIWTRELKLLAPGEVRPSLVGGLFEGRVSRKTLSKKAAFSKTINLLNNKHYISCYGPEKIIATMDNITGNARLAACK